MIYVMGTGPSAIVKIGTAINPESRLRQIQAGHPEPLRLLLTLPGDRTTETWLHQVFAARRVSIREWFDFTDSNAVDEVSSALAVEEAIDTAPQDEPATEDEAVEQRRFRLICMGAKGGSGVSSAAVWMAQAQALVEHVALHDISSTQGSRSWSEFARRDGVWPSYLPVSDGGTGYHAVEVFDVGRFWDLRATDEMLRSCDRLAFFVQDRPMDVMTAIDVLPQLPPPVRERLRVVLLTMPTDPDGWHAREQIEESVHWATFCRITIPWREERAQDFGYAGEDCWLGAYADLAEELLAPERVVL